MIRWGTAKEYAWLYLDARTEQYRNILKAFIQSEGPKGLWLQVEKELARAKKASKAVGDPAQTRRTLEEGSS